MNKIEHRLYINDLNPIRKIGDFQIINYAIKKIAFLDDKPIATMPPDFFWECETDSGKYDNLSLEHVIAIFKRNIEFNQDLLDQFKEAITKAPILESEIKSDDAKPLSLKEKKYILDQLKFKYEFEKPKDINMDENVNITSIFEEASKLREGKLF